MSNSEHDPTYDNPLRFVKRVEVRKLTGWSEPTLWRRMRDGQWPPPTLRTAATTSGTSKPLWRRLRTHPTKQRGMRHSNVASLHPSD